MFVILIPFFVEDAYSVLGDKNKIRRYARIIISIIITSAVFFLFLIFNNDLIEESKKFIKYREFFQMAFKIGIITCIFGMSLSVLLIDCMSTVLRKRKGTNT